MAIMRNAKEIWKSLRGLSSPILMIFSRQEKASISLGISNLLTLVTVPVNLKLKHTKVLRFGT